MNGTEIFALYDIQQPLGYEVKDTSREEEDHRKAILAEWPDRKIVIKITDNAFTTPERVHGWAETMEAYIASGYYCPRIIRNRKGAYTADILVDGRKCLVYAEEFSRYKTADSFPKSEITRGGLHTFSDDALRTIGVIGAKHLDTAAFPSGFCILETFSPLDPCDEVMEESLHFKKVVDEFLPQWTDRFARIWNLFEENKKELEKIYPSLPVSVFQGDLNDTNILLDDHGNFVGMLDFNLCGRDTVLNYLFREILLEYDIHGNDIFYSQKANEETTALFLSKVRLAGETYPFSEAEKNAAPLVYRYLRPFWWRPSHEIKQVKDDARKVRCIFEWVENELTRTDISL
ncbi:MAG: hypothetical protein NC121_15835 [Blautia sp.]|nr:hypothetical protein [Blautia sp.]